MKNEVKIMKKIIIKGLSAILCAGMVFLSACSTQTNDDTSKENGNTAADSQQSYVTVTFDSNGGNAVNEIKVKKGDTLTLPEEPVKDGYVFCGWNTNPEAEAWVDTIDFSMYRIDADVTLHAIWGNEDYDLDEDGLSHKDEIANSTDPDLYDTDKDGISDGDEVNKYHTIPSSDDSDGDTLLDGFEVAVGLNPLEKQSDGKTNDADKSISYTFSESDDGYSLTIEGNTKMMSSISTSTFDKSIADNSNNIISDIISIEKGSSDPFESADLVYSYKNDSLGSLSEDDLSILYLNEDTGKYEVVSSVINKANKTISAKLSHFSKYAIGGLSLANSNHLLSTKSITYNGKTIKAVEVADSGFDLLKHSFAFHNFQTKDCPGGFCGGFSLVSYLNYIEKLPISAEKYSNLTAWNIPGYNISSSSRFVENNIYLTDEKDLFNNKNNYETDNVQMSDSTKEAVNCIEHWWGKQHGFADRFVTPDVAEKNRYKKILIEKLQSGEPVPLTLYEWSLGTNVHSVLAYKMYETSDADYILVYDSNFPGEERYIKISSFFSIFTGAEYKMGSDSYPIVKISYVPIPDGPYVSHTAVAEEEPSTDIEFTAEDLINKPVKEIVELMGETFDVDKYQSFFYNNDVFPGLEFYVDCWENDENKLKEAIKKNNPKLIGIQVNDTGAGFRYKDTIITADMDFSALSLVFGEMNCKRGTGALMSGTWEGIAYTIETDNCKATINYDVNWDVSKYLSDDIEIPVSEMKEHNPNIKNIAIVIKSESTTNTPEKAENNDHGKWDDYVSLLNEFVSSGKWTKLSETEIKDTHSVFSSEIMNYNDISNPDEWSITSENKHIFDMDGDGTPEMILRIEHNGWGGPSGPATNTEFVTVKNGKAQIIMNAYWTGGSMRGDSLFVCKNSTDNKYYIGYNSHMRIDEGNHEVSRTYYEYSNGSASEIHNIRRNQSYDWSGNWSSINSEPAITCTIDGKEASETEFDSLSNSFSNVSNEDLPK